MNPPLCPLHQMPMVRALTVEGRDIFKCAKKGCTIEISRPQPPTEKPAP